MGIGKGRTSLLTERGLFHGGHCDCDVPRCRCGCLRVHAFSVRNQFECDFAGFVQMRPNCVFIGMVRIHAMTLTR